MTVGRIAIGVDIGGSNIRVALIGENGQRIALERESVGADRKPATIVSRIGKVVSRLTRREKIALDELSGIGIGVAAQLDAKAESVLVSPNLGWRDVPIGRLFLEELGLRVTIINDLEAIALGEVLHGAARGHDDVLVVFVGTGVGGGLILGGRLYRGASGLAAEIGHVKVSPGGRDCGCGQQGCLEAYLGGANLTRRLEEEAEDGWTELSRLASEGLHPGLVEELVTIGNRRAEELYEELAGYFGQVLANAVTLLNPSALVLGGTVLDGCPTLRALSESILLKQVLQASGATLLVLSAELGSDAGVVGAASHVLREKERLA